MSSSSQAHPAAARVAQPLPVFRSPEFLRAHVQQTLAFYAPREIDSSGGFFQYFKDDGSVYDRRSRHLVSSTRFVFNHAMALRHFGDPAHRDAVAHGVRFLRQAHAKPGGGYAWTLEWDGEHARVLDATNHGYGLAFVLLAYAHALRSGIEESAAWLEETFELMEHRLWEPEHALYADEADAQWRVGAYRGQNANMHACEAMLAAFDATGQARYLERAELLADSVTQRLAQRAGGLVWEHYDAAWSPDWEYNRGDRSNIFRPWGYQTGHLTEWAKLLLMLEQRLPKPRRDPSLLERARHLFDTAMRHGWDAGHGGLVYGFAPDGQVYDADKYFWVHAESFAAAAALAVRTGEEAYWDWYERIWQVSWQHLVDHRYGAWFRIRGPAWEALDDCKSPAGKTDYHTMGACYEVLHWLDAPRAR
jgi:mannose/cellobiose epimerase-like protein (N-acyl-D-glucosamine 2-epimerase family)